MSMHEIADLLTDTVELWRGEPRAPEMTWNLEALPERLELDTAIAPTGAAPAEPIHVYELGAETMALAASRGRADLVYDWCAFLLGFWSHMPTTEDYAADRIASDWFPKMRAAFDAVDTTNHQPRHRSLTLRPDGHPSWFTDEHNALIRAFFA